MHRTRLIAGEIPLVRAQVHQLAQHLRAKYLKDALPHLAHRRHRQQLARAVPQLERLVRMRQAIVRHQRGNVRQFRGLRPQKLLSRRHIEEEVAHGNSRPARQRHFFHLEQLAPGNLHPRPRGLFLRPRL